MHLKKVIALLLISFFGFSMLGMLPVRANGTVIKCYSDVTQLGDPATKVDVVGTPFQVAVVVEGPSDMDMYAFDIQFNWTTDWIAYVDHEVTVPVDDYPAVQPPSPYAGILNAPIMKLTEAIDESASIPFADPGTMAWLAWSESGTTPTFNNSGTIVVIDFVVTNQPYCYDKNATVKIHFLTTDLSTDAPGPISHSKIDLEIPLYCRLYEYKPSPMLKLTPEDITAPSDCVCQNFTVDVTLLGADGNDLNPVWDVAGCDFYVNFNTTLIEAVDIDIDPDGDFGVFWSAGTYELLKEIDNLEGWAHIAFMGLGTHSAVFGTIRVAEITFHIIYEHVGYPPPEAPIFIDSTIHDIKTNPWFIMDADGGLIDLSMPVGEDFTALFPYAMFPTGFSLDDWEDVNGDGLLTNADQIKLHNTATCKSHWYKVTCVQITLQLTQLAFQTVDDYVWPASFGMDGLANNGLPGKYVGTDDPYDGYGVPYWTGNFSTAYAVESVNQINCTYLPFTGDEYTLTLTEGVDYIVHPDDDLIELLVPQDVDIVNEYWNSSTNPLSGWPWINYVASSIQEVTVHFPNCTTRPANNLGYTVGEWWYDPDWPWELEGWYALGPYGSPGEQWPDGSEWWINYTAASYLTIDYNADPDPRPYYMEFDGTVEEFLALTDPNCTDWQEIYPNYDTWWHCISTDLIEVCNNIRLDAGGGMVRDYHIDKISIDLMVVQKRFVQDKGPTDNYYLDPIWADIAGFPHPERPMSPWYSSPYPVALPNEVEDAMYTSCYMVLGRQIDLYLCDYPDGHNGRGPNNPGDMFWPQKEVCLCAEVTYNLWPEQQKDVAFEVIDPYGAVYTLLCTRTDSTGLAMICFRLPWMCDDPEYYFGEWTVIASVDVACEHINDTMNFKYDYMVHIWKVTTDASSYAHGECIEVTIDYGSAATQTYTILLSVSGLDETGVPFDWGYVFVTVGGAEYCTYANDTTTVIICIPKWARAGKATIHVNALWPSLPRYGGVQQYPLVTEEISIRAE